MSNFVTPCLCCGEDDKYKTYYMPLCLCYAKSKKLPPGEFNDCCPQFNKEEFETCISPCYCFTIVTRSVVLEGDSKSKEVNKYIKDNKIRQRDDTYEYCTFGRFLIKEGPLRQSMTNEEVERIVNNNIVKEHIQSLEMGDGKNISSLIGDFI